MAFYAMPCSGPATKHCHQVGHSNGSKAINYVEPLSVREKASGGIKLAPSHAQLAAAAGDAVSNKSSLDDCCVY